MKIQLIYVTLWSLTQAVYISRMAAINRLRGPTPMRPGVMLHRPWTPPRIMQAGSHRSPYIIYRNSPHRYAMKHISPSATRSIYHAPWKTTARLPPLTAATPEYEFIRASPSTPIVHTDGTDAIHTIPAPNLSLSEKPIVVIDSLDNSNSNTATEATKPVYEVTEKYPEPPTYELSPRIEPPVGFSKTNSLNPAELQNIRNNVALQIASEYGIPVSALSPPSIIPQQFSIPGFNRMPTHQDLLHSGTEGIIIPPNALYQPDPMFLQKLQAQLLQQFPAIEFIPYATPDFQHQVQTQPPEQSDLFLLENEQFTKQPPSSFIPSQPDHNKNLVQRETQEGTILSLLPQGFSINNVTERSPDATTTIQTQNITTETTTEATQTSETTVNQIVDTATAEQRTAPIFYAQIGQSVGNAVANGFYSAINDVRAAAALAEDEKLLELPKAQPFNTTSTSTTTTTTTTSTTTMSTLQPDLKDYFVQNSDKNSSNASELKPLMGAPFEKQADSVNVAYTLLRADKDNQTTTKDGVVYAGQLVEATISEDQEFNKEKAHILSRRPPLRLFTIPDKRTEPPQTVSVVKAKIPPKSKLTFDDKTGEPVLRIYASYINSPLQRERITSKLSSMKYINEALLRKQDNLAPVKALNKTQGSERNQVSEFGLKLRSRSDDDIPLFDEYEE